MDDGQSLIQPTPDGAGLTQHLQDVFRHGPVGLALFDALPDLIAVVDEHHRVVHANKAMIERLGRTPEECLGSCCHEIVHGLPHVPGFCPHRAALEDGREHVAEVREERLGGDFLVSCTPLAGPDGKPIGSVHVARDITERKRAEEALRESRAALLKSHVELEQRVQERTAELARANQELQVEMAERHKAEAAAIAERQRLKDVLDLLPAYVVLLTPDYHVPLANRFFEERFGKAEGRRCYEYLFDRTEPCEFCDTYTVLKTNSPHHWEWTGPDGRNYDIYDFPFTDTDGSPLIMEMGIDITERKQAEAALHDLNESLERRVAERAAALGESEQRLRWALQGAAGGAWDWDLASGHAWWSSEMYELWGVEPGTRMDPNKSLALIHQQDRQRLRNAIDESIVRRGDFQCEFRVRHPVRGERWMAARGRPVYDESGSAVRMLGITLDITDRKRAEAEIRSLAQFPEENPNPVIRAAADGTVLYANESARTRLKQLNWEADEKLPEHLLTALSRVLSLGEPEEMELACPDGRFWSFSLAPNPEDGYVNLYGRDITEQKQTEQALRERQKDLNHAQAVAHTGSWRLDVRRDELIWSDENHRMFGIPKGTALKYETFLAAAHPDDREYVDTRWQAALRGERYDIEHRIVVGEEVKWVRERAELEFDADGILLGGFGTTQDITERKQVQDILSQAKEVAEAANEAKSQFLAIMSHELRTPMNAILGMTNLALSEEIPATVRDYLQTAKESADVLLELLNQILDFSRIEAGRFDLESTPFNLRQTVEWVVKTAGVRAYEKGLELICELPDDLPKYVLGDQLRLRQVLINLIGNATKFTASGEIVVQVSIEQRTAETASLRFSVSDTGIGIAPEDLEKIFSPFTQADASTTRHYGGSGLGLAIAQRLVTLMGGQIGAESRPDEGSTFFFTLTLPIHQEAAEEVVTCLPDEQTFKSVPVLVVAQSATNRRILQQTLASWSMQPEAVADVPSALAKIHETAASGQTYRLVLADAEMPGIDGFTLAEWLQNEPHLAGPVILMLSTGDRQNHPDRCKDLQVQCLDKPIAQSTLFTTIAGALGVQGRPEISPIDRRRTEPPTTAPRPLRVLLAEDTPANQKLVLYILGKRGHTVTVAQNGQEALELLGQQDFDVVLMDVQMPLLDGFQATAAIRRLPDLKKARLPIIAMTAHALKGDRQRCTKAGMDGYLSKPIRGKKLIATIERLAEVSATSLQQPAVSSQQSVISSSQSEIQDPQPEARNPKPAVFDVNQGIERCYGNYEMFQSMVGFFFDEADGSIDRLQLALDRAQPEELARTAHRLKNTVVYLGSRPAIDTITRLEQIGHSAELSGGAEAIEELRRQLDALKEAISPHRKKR